jgi:hypothetical protein
MQRRYWTMFALGVWAAAVASAATAAARQVGPRGGEPVVVRVDEGFHWLDAAIGALAAAGIALLVVGFVLATRRGVGPRARETR